MLTPSRSVTICQDVPPFVDLMRPRAFPEAGKPQSSCAVMKRTPAWYGEGNTSVAAGARPSGQAFGMTVVQVSPSSCERCRPLYVQA